MDVEEAMEYINGLIISGNDCNEVTRMATVQIALNELSPCEIVDLMRRMGKRDELNKFLYGLAYNAVIAGCEEALPLEDVESREEMQDKIASTLSRIIEAVDAPLRWAAKAHTVEKIVRSLGNEELFELACRMVVFPGFVDMIRDSIVECCLSTGKKNLGGV